MIRRAPRKDHFTVLPNALLEDPSVSFKAKGLLAYILSKPDNWRANSRQLANAGPDGRTAVRAGLNELAEAGYAVMTTGRNPDGTYASEWVISEVPGTKPATGVRFSDSGLSDSGFPDPLVSTDEQVLNRTTASPTENLRHLKAVKDQLRHVGGG